MATNKKANVLATIKTQMEKLIADGTKAILKSDLSALYKAEEALNKAEKEYERVLVTIIYDELLATTEPIVEAIKRYSYKTLRHRDKKSEGESKKVIGLELVEKERQLDLLKFCEYSKSAGGVELPTDWQYAAAKLNQLLCLRAAKTLKCTDAEIAEIAKSYYLKEQARKLEMGETPTSDTQICKALQIVINGIIFKDDGKGGNAYKCNNHDVAYLLGCYTKKGKKALSLAVAKDGFFRLVITEICLRIIENGRYTVEGYKTVKE